MSLKLSWKGDRGAASKIAKKVVNSIANYQILHKCILHLAQLLYSSFFASVAPQPPHEAVGDPLKLKCGFQGER